jgi:cellulose synthase/poly-beta-1,6-N-acetylglucosamine synthase-like glycosyltransferase
MWILGGLDKLGLILPLGGTSNHFSMEALNKVAESNGPLDVLDGPRIAGPWDPFNVTEDADLAIRLAAAGYSTHMFRSITWEEPPDTLHKAMRQRSRWNKGYFQTGLVWTRRPLAAIRAVGLVRWLGFCWLMFATPLTLLINPWTWALTAAYVVAHMLRIEPVVTFIQALFPAPVYYLGMTVALAGNGLLLYQKLVAPTAWQELFETGTLQDDSVYASRLSRQLYGLSFRMLLTPIWWAVASGAAYLGVPEVVLPSRRHAWVKTEHGHHQELEDALEQVG